MRPTTLVRASTLRALLRARDHLHAHAFEALSVPALARTARLSPYHFIRAFEQAFGSTPHRYQTALRLERAREILRRPDGTVTAACFDTGFSSLGSWSALFSRRFGLPPSAYHRAMTRLWQVPAPFQRVFVPMCFLGHFAIPEKPADGPR